ncbi:MAG: polysaccharide biosynthesis/export family protein [Rhodoferax sp.]|jgi:polysaccharide export outer membrane protein|nr:polysaccharide biosynthesis/export family protein [Rhodoferax sp.]
MLKPASRRLSFVLLAALLNGCALAPGMYVGKAKTGSSSANWFSSDTDTSADAPPPGKIIAITPSLIRQMRTETAVDISPDVKKLFDFATPYQIGPGDVLNIVVWDHPELSLAPAASNVTSDAGSVSTVGNGFNVNPQGLIQFPYAGTLKVAGLTEFEVRDLLAKHLTKYIKDPQITVRIQAYRSGRVYIDGEVRTPGLQALNDIPMTLPEAIGRAGGVTALADRSAIAVTRGNTTAVVNLPQLTARGINPTSILLRNGDLVRVLGREEAKVFVMGEVLRPSSQTLRNGRLTLNEALGDAGGVSQVSADPRQIFVVRAANTETPEIYHLDARSPTAFALAEGFELKARDVVYVDPVPLVRWNRVISLILPSAAAVTTTRNALN